MSGAIPLILIHAFTAWTGTTLPFYPSNDTLLQYITALEEHYRITLLRKSQGMNFKMSMNNSFTELHKTTYS
jgi:hypothetical protein